MRCHILRYQPAVPGACYPSRIFSSHTNHDYSSYRKSSAEESYNLPGMATQWTQTVVYLNFWCSPAGLFYVISSHFQNIPSKSRHVKKVCWFGQIVDMKFQISQFSQISTKVQKVGRTSLWISASMLKFIRCISKDDEDNWGEMRSYNTKQCEYVWMLHRCLISLSNLSAAVQPNFRVKWI